MPQYSRGASWQEYTKQLFVLSLVELSGTRNVPGIESYSEKEKKPSAVYFCLKRDLLCSEHNSNN